MAAVCTHIAILFPKNSEKRGSLTRYPGAVIATREAHYLIMAFGNTNHVKEGSQLLLNHGYDDGEKSKWVPVLFTLTVISMYVTFCKGNPSC